MSQLEIEKKLIQVKAAYEIIHQDRPILSAADAEGYYPLEKAAPTFVLQTENGLIGCIVSYQHGRLDFEKMKEQFGYSKLKMAGEKKIKAATGFEIGAIPLAGLNLPCLFDRKLLAHDYVYGGTGDEFHTLKIAPSELLKAITLTGMFE